MKDDESARSVGLAVIKRVSDKYGIAIKDTPPPLKYCGLAVVKTEGQVIRAFGEDAAPSEPESVSDDVLKFCGDPGFYWLKIKGFSWRPESPEWVVGGWDGRDWFVCGDDVELRAALIAEIGPRLLWPDELQSITRDIARGA